MFWKGRAAKWTSFAACGTARDMELARTPPEGRSLSNAPSVNETQNQNAFSRVSAIFASCASFLHTFFWQDRNGTKQQTSEAFAVWRGRAAQWTRPAACGGARDMKLARTSRRRHSYSVAVKTTPPVHPERSTNAMLPAGLYCIRRICYSDTQKNAKSAAQGAAPLEAMNLPLDGAKFDAGRR